MEYGSMQHFQRETALRQVLDNLKIPAESSGSRMLMSAVLKAADAPERPLCQIMDEIAEAENCSSGCVSRRIRHAVLSAWENSGIEKRMGIEKFIRYAVSLLHEVTCDDRK